MILLHLNTYPFSWLKVYYIEIKVKLIYNGINYIENVGKIWNLCTSIWDTLRWLFF